MPPQPAWLEAASPPRRLRSWCIAEADVSTACLDWAERLRSGRSIIPPPIFPAQAEQALAVFKALRIVDAPGSPTFGECCAPWVFDLVASIFGAYDPDSGRRLITEWFVLIPKKNAKSTIAAGIMMTALVLNWRQSAEFSILAPTIEVAGNSFAPARDMCSERHDDELSALMHVQTHVKTITHRDSGAILKVVAADAETVGGKKGVGNLIDELWLFGKQSGAENMLREATGGLASRPEGFVIYLTTQSDDPPAGVFRQKLQYARNVRDGKIVDDRFVPVIYEFPPDMIERGEHKDPANFGMVNPNLNYSVDREFLEREFMKAENDGPESMRGFLAKHLNVEIGLALMSNRWAGADFWEKQADETISFETMLQRSSVIAVGIDGGGNDDLYGFTALGKDKKTGDLLSWSRAWALPIVLERRKEIADRLRDFAKQGDLVIVQKIEDACEEVVGLIKRVDAAGLLGTLDDGKRKAIGVDPAGIKQTLDALNAAEYPDHQVCAVSQGWRLGSSIKSTELYLSSEALSHADQPLMNWCVGNAKVEPKGNSILITKQASGTAKIDPLMSLFNAVELMARNPAAAREYQVFFAGGGR
jgi:phage terminase large subunit-like protein